LENSNIIEALKLNAGILREFIGAIPDKDIKKRRKDFWTIYEHLEHLVVTQVMLYRRIDNFIKAEKPVIKAYTPDDKPKSAGTKTAGELLGDFSKWRDKQLELIQSCDIGV
jgi:hypothetical protein